MTVFGFFHSLMEFIFLLGRGGGGVWATWVWLIVLLFSSSLISLVFSIISSNNGLLSGS